MKRTWLTRGEGEHRGVKLYIVNVERAMAIVSFYLFYEYTINTNIVIANVSGILAFFLALRCTKEKSKIVDRIIIEMSLVCVPLL